jgi:flagellar M-ring protein FliF
VSEPPLWKQPEIVDLVRALAVPGALGAVALLVMFGLVRPALRAARPATAPGSRLDTVVEDEQTLPALTPGSVPALAAPQSSVQLEQARTLARQNPAAVAGIVRDWVSNEGAA